MEGQVAKAGEVKEMGTSRVLAVEVALSLSHYRDGLQEGYLGNKDYD
jgi:hypothetical protein